MNTVNFLLKRKSANQEVRISSNPNSNSKNLTMRLFQIAGIVFSTLLSFPALCQTLDSFTVSAGTIKTVVIETSALTRLKTSSEIKVSSSLKSEGKIYGFQIPSVRPAFQLSKKISGDTLYIQTPKIFSPSTIGVSTYQENITNTIEIPFGITVILIQAESLEILDFPSNLQIKEARKVVGSALQKKDISRLECLATIGLTLNGKKGMQAYEINHLGRSTISIHAEEISLTLN